MSCFVPAAAVFLTGIMMAPAQAPNGAWVYPSATGNLLYQLDERGQRIADFSNCGYRGGLEPLPDIPALIPQSRWTYVSPGTGDDTALIQAAINTVAAMSPDANGWRGVVFLNAGEYQLANSLSIAASGVVLKGAGTSPTSGTRLRATDARQYTLINVSGSGSAGTVSGTTRNIIQKLMPAGSRTFEVDSTTGLAVGHTVIVKRPSTANWIEDMDMDQLGPAPVVPWTAGSKDLLFDRVITRIDGNWITVDAPLPQTIESQYGGGQVWRYGWSGRIQQVGIEDIYGFSDYAGNTDEDHAWKFIQINRTLHGWVRNIVAQYFGYSAVSVGDGSKWLTVADSQCLDPISLIEGGRRYSFNNEGAELTLFLNNYARKGRHDFVFGSTVPGPNAFVHCRADTAYSDTGPHHRWSVGGLFDNITVNGNSINVQNRGNSGTGHGWAGAYMAVWNSVANSFRVRNPPTARNWLVGSTGSILASSSPVGADPAGTYDSSGTSGIPVHPRSLYFGQLQQRLKWPGSEFRESWLGDVDQHYSTGGTGNPANCDPAWLAQVKSLGPTPADSLFDYLVGGRMTAFTFDLATDPGETIVAASLTISLRAIGAGSEDDTILLDDTANPQTLSSIGWTPVSTAGSTVRTMEVNPALLEDGKLNVALGPDVVVDFATLQFQVGKAQPSSHRMILNPVADATVRAGTYADTNDGVTTSIQTKDVTASSVNREAFLRWDLSGITGRLIDARVRLAVTAASQIGNESCASFVDDDTWEESSLTFNNKPDSGNHFAQWLPVTGKAEEFSVLPQLKETLIGDGKLSLRIRSTDDFGPAGNVSYASRENANASIRPQLILTFENSAPSISGVADQLVVEDTPTAATGFTVGDDFTPAASLTVTAVSSNTALVPDANIILNGDGADRTIVLTPAPGRSGSAVITLTASDGSLSSSESFALTVNPVNDPPVAMPGNAVTPANQAVDIDLRSLASDSETPDSGLRFSVSGGVNGTVTLLADGHTARFLPASQFSGPASFNYSVTDATPDPRILLNYDFQPPDVSTDGFSSDVSGNGRDGTFTSAGTGSATYVTDIPGVLSSQQNQSLRLTENGSAGASRLQRLVSATNELNFQTADWTVAGWVKRISADNQDIIFHLGSANGRGGTNDFVLSFGNGSSNGPLYLRNWGTSLDVDISTPVSSAAWHHFAVVRAGGTLSLYVDGGIIASDDSFSLTSSNANPAIFGGGASNNSTVHDRWFNGSMADLAIFKAALTGSEITTLSTAPVANLAGLTDSNAVGVEVIADTIQTWRQHYFQTPGNAGSAADAEDPDGDGLANADEYVFGTDPTVAGAAPFLTIAPAGNEITLSFSAKRAEGPGYAGLGRRFTVEATTDLHNPASWSPVKGFSEIPGDNQNITLTLPADGSRRFFRLRIGL
jgi:hypothetical protein